MGKEKASWEGKDMWQGEEQDAISEAAKRKHGLWWYNGKYTCKPHVFLVCFVYTDLVAVLKTEFSLVKQIKSVELKLPVGAQLKDSTAFSG